MAVSPCRYDERDAGSSEDDSTKRKKDFSDLFKQQMNLRKVNRSNQHVQAVEKQILAVFVLFCLCTSVCQLCGAGGRGLVVNHSHMFIRLGKAEKGNYSSAVHNTASIKAGMS